MKQKKWNMAKTVSIFDGNCYLSSLNKYTSSLYETTGYTGLRLFFNQLWNHIFSWQTNH